MTFWACIISSMDSLADVLGELLVASVPVHPSVDEVLD